MSVTLPAPVSTQNSVAIAANRAFQEIDPDFYIWQRLPREPQIWYNRFVEFLSMKSYERSILRVCNRERERNGLPPRTMTPHDWTLFSQAWRWKLRAQSYDAHEAERLMREYEEEKERVKKKRLTVLSTFHDKVSDAINQFDPEEDAFRLSEVTGAIDVIGKQYRAEFDTEPTKKKEVKITSMADLLRESERDIGYGNSEIIDAEFR